MVCRCSAHNVLLLGPPGAGTSRLARRLTTILLAMTLPEAIDTTRLPRVAGRTGDYTALVTTRPFRAPHHTISAVGLIGGGQVPMPGEGSRARTMGCSCWMNCRSSAATSGRSCASRSRRVSYEYNLTGVLNLKPFVELALRMIAVRDGGRAR
jgi:hypothetical protein